MYPPQEDGTYAGANPHNMCTIFTKGQLLMMLTTTDPDGTLSRICEAQATDPDIC